MEGVSFFSSPENQIGLLSWQEKVAHDMGGYLAA